MHNTKHSHLAFVRTILFAKEISLIAPVSIHSLLSTSSQLQSRLLPILSCPFQLLSIILSFKRWAERSTHILGTSFALCSNFKSSNNSIISKNFKNFIENEKVIPIHLQVHIHSLSLSILKP